MSEASGIPLIESGIEDKFEYKGILYPNQKKTIWYQNNEQKSYTYKDVLRQ